jgi:hypothetical protein
LANQHVRVPVEEYLLPVREASADKSGKRPLGGGSVGVVVLGFVLVIVFVIALGWLPIVSRPE